ncbi:hypothetical protein DB346_16450 [Verrucomicrobia bacterium LW23]|nr:hypothetical protein DB346_16450 [Verrucomicrobia bacterium LW23]
MRQPALQPLLRLKLSETTGEILLSLLRTFSHSGLSYARRWYNLAIDFGWIPMNLLPRRHWPKIRSAERRAITCEEHGKLLESVHGEDDWYDYFQALWWLGAAQTDLARLTAERVNLAANQILFKRTKIRHRGRGWTCAVMGPSLRAIIEKRMAGKQSYLFPALAVLKNSYRSTHPAQRAAQLPAAHYAERPLRPRHHRHQPARGIPGRRPAQRHVAPRPHRHPRRGRACP